MTEHQNMADANKKSTNFLRQFRDLKTREFKQITAAQFMDVWNHYDDDGRSFFFINFKINNFQAVLIIRYLKSIKMFLFTLQINIDILYR